MRLPRAKSDDTGASLVVTLLSTMLIMAMLGALLTYLNGSNGLIKPVSQQVQDTYNIDGALKTAMTNAETTGLLNNKMNCPDGFAFGDLIVDCEVRYAAGTDPSTSTAGGNNGTVSPTDVNVYLHPGDTYNVPTPKSVQVPNLNEVIEVPTEVALTPEVFFLADTTCSMQAALTNVSAASGQITDAILAKSATAKFGVGEYRDTDTGFGTTSPRNPYRVNTTPMLTTAAAARTAMAAWREASCGNDTPEDNLAALYQVANNWTVSTDPNVKRVLVWFGDAPGWESSRYSVGGSTVSRDRLFSALDAKKIQVISISLHSSSYPFPTTHSDPDPYWGLNVDLNAHPNPPAAPSPTEGTARLASTGNVNLASTSQPTVDGIQVANGDEVLLKNQTNAAQNGVYTANRSLFGSWSWSRISNANSDGELAVGSWVRVTSGTQAGDWSVTAIGGTGTWTVGTDSTTWSPYTIPLPTFVGQGIYLSNATGGTPYSGVSSSQVADKIIAGLSRIDFTHITVPVPVSVTYQSTCNGVDLTPTSSSTTVTGGGVVEFSETITAGTTTPNNCQVTFLANGAAISNAVETNNITVVTTATAVFTARNAAGTVLGTTEVSYDFSTNAQGDPVRTVNTIDSWYLNDQLGAA